MKYFNEMTEKFGFNDGDSMPDHIDCYREVYVEALNTLLEALGSNTRVREFDRFGLHNSCLILLVIGDNTDAPFSQTDAAFDDAMDLARDLDLDDYVETTVEVHLDAALTACDAALKQRTR